MLNSYNSLSNYLNKSFSNNSNINEGFFDGLSKLFGRSTSADKKSKSEETAMSGLFGWVKSLITSDNSTDDPILKKYNDIATKEADDERKRLRDEIDAENQLEIAKLDAEYKRNKNQLDIASQNKIKTINAYKKQAEDAGKRFENNKLLYTAEQNRAMQQQLSELGKNLTIADDSPAKKMKDLAMIICVDKDGAPRSKEQILEAINTDPDLKSAVDEYNKLAEENNETLLNAMDSDEFKEKFKAATNQAYKNSNIDNDITEAKEKLKQFESTVTSVSKIKDLEKKYSDAADAYKKKNTEFSDKTNVELNPFAKGYNEATGDVDELKPADFRPALNTIIKSDNCKGEDGFISIEKVKQELTNLGIDETTINKIVPGPNEVVSDMQKAIENNINNSDTISDEDCKQLAKTVKEKTEASIRTTKNELDAKQTELDNQINVKELLKDVTKDNKDDIIGEVKNKMKNAGISDEEIKQVENHFSNYCDAKISGDLDKGNFDVTSKDSPGSKLLKDINAEVSSLEKEKQKLKDQQEANKRVREQAEKNIQFRKDNSIPDDIKDKVEKQLQGLEAGEQFKDGKVGFKDKDGKFHEKPGPDASNDKVKEYIAKRNEHIITLDLSTNDTANTEIESVKQNDDGSYSVKFKGDDEPKSCTEEEAIYYKANQIAANRSRGEILAKKQEVANDVNKYIKDGKLDIDTLKSLRDSDKDSDKEKYNDVMSNLKILANNKDKLDVYFKDVDMIGSDTLDNVKEILKNDELLDDLYKNSSNDDDYEDVEDEDEDAADDNKYDDDEDKELSDEEKELKNKYQIIKGSPEEFEKWKKVSDLEDETEKLKDKRSELQDKIANAESEEEKQRLQKEEQEIANKIHQNLDKTKEVRQEAIQTSKNSNGPEKNKIKNPAKEWKRKKKANGTGMTKNYYNSDKESISADEYKERMERYKRAKAKASQGQTSSNNESLQYTELRNFLLEKFSK